MAWTIKESWFDFLQSFFSLQLSDRFWGPPRLLSSGYRGGGEGGSDPGYKVQKPRTCGVIHHVAHGMGQSSSRKVSTNIHVNVAAIAEELGFDSQLGNQIFLFSMISVPARGCNQPPI
jgi:hypothetical protein